MWRIPGFARDAARLRMPSAGGLLLIASVVIAASAGQASAQEQDTLRVEVDKAHLIQLKEDAATVMIADPEIADVAVESPRMVFVLGRALGETTLFILDADGNRLVDANILVEAQADMVEAEADTPAPSLAVAPAPAKQKEQQVTVVRNVTEEETLSCSPICGGGEKQ